MIRTARAGATTSNIDAGKQTTLVLVCMFKLQMNLDINKEGSAGDFATIIVTSLR